MRSRDTDDPDVFVIDRVVIIVGGYVYHCHIVQHEDQGMMANLLVQDGAAALMKADEPPDLIAQALTPLPSR